MMDSLLRCFYAQEQINKSTEDEFDQPQGFKSQAFLPNQILPKLFSFRISIYHYQDLKRILN